MLLRSYGGGGKLWASPTVGEFELGRPMFPRDGENMERGGNRGFGPCHGCGVKPVWKPLGVVPCQKVGVYGRAGSECILGVVPGRHELVELDSEAELEGGVRRLLTLEECAC